MNLTWEMQPGRLFFSEVRIESEFMKQIKEAQEQDEYLLKVKKQMKQGKQRELGTAFGKGKKERKEEKIERKEKTMREIGEGKITSLFS